MRYYLSIALSIFLLCAAAFAQDARESIDVGGEIVGLSGSVEVMLSQSEAYEPAQEDMFLQAQDNIRTGPASSAEIAFDEDGKNVVRLDSDTEATIIIKSSEKMELLKGEVLSTIGYLPEGSSFEIRTPTAVSGARGTDWVTKVEGDETTVESLDGSPYVRGIDESGILMKEEVLAPGFAAGVRRFQKPSMPVRLPEARRARLNDIRMGVKQRAPDVIRKRKMYPEQHNRAGRMKVSRERLMERKKDQQPMVNDKQGQGRQELGKPPGKQGMPGQGQKKPNPPVNKPKQGPGPDPVRPR